MIKIKKSAPEKVDQENNLNQVTLIIPTFNRPKYLARLLNYYATKKTAIHFLILDSSDMQSIELNRQTCLIFGSQARYVTFPSSTPFATKLLAGLKLVDTPFCVFCADDDLVFVEGLRQALTFLQENSDYVCADGIYLRFYNTTDIMHLDVEYAIKGIDASDPGARIFRLCQHYESLFYSVFRTHDAINIYSTLSKLETLHYQELFQAISALLIGKTYRLPVFYAARQNSETAEPTRDKWQTFYWFADNSGELLEHYLVYREELWNFYQNYAPEPRRSKEIFFQLIDITHGIYFARGCSLEYFHSVLCSQWPNDAFQYPNNYHNHMCNHLKNSLRVRLEKFIIELSNFSPKVIPSLYSILALRSLNAKVQKNTNTKWKCKLSRKMRWLVSVNIFRDAYKELCQYASLNKEY